MSRVLLSGFRLRVGDENYDSPDVDAPLRLVFTDSSTSTPKEVYSGPYDEPSLGSVVDLDAQGYVPESGVWLDVGRYNIAVEQRISSDPEDWQQLYSINKVAGGDADGVVDDTTIRFVDTIADIRALSGEDLGGLTFNTGYYTPNDGGQRAWRWNSASLVADDGGAVLIPNGQAETTAGRWEAVFPEFGRVNIRQWGAIPGIGDVSGNIEKADDYCGRTSDDSGITLVFPAGKYQIGTAVIELNKVGQTEIAEDRPVHYHIEENCSFSGGLGGGISFYGPTTVDSTTYIYTFLRLTNVVSGYVRPEWWGAVGDGLTDDQAALNYCWNRSAQQRIYMTKQYFIEFGLVDNGVSGGGPAVRFAAGAEIILDSGCDGVQIGNVIRDNPLDQIISGDYSKLRLSGKRYKASYFNIATVSELSALSTSAASWGLYELFWDMNFTFDGSFTDPGSSSGAILHSFDAISVWNIGSNTVEVQQAALTSDRKYFVLNDSSLINIRNVSEINPAWFGAVNESGIQLTVERMLKSVVAFNYSVDWRNGPVGVSGVINLATVSGNDIVIRNANIISSNVNADVLNISGDGKVTLLNSEIKYSSQSAFSCMVSQNLQTIVKDCRFTFGNVFLKNTGSYEFNGNYVLSGDVYAYSNDGYKQIKNNVFHHSFVNLYVADSYLKLMDFISNKLINNRFTDPNNESFVYLVPVGVGCVCTNVKILDNNYCDLSDVSGTPHSVRDSGDTVFNTWSSIIAQDILITGETANSGSGAGSVSLINLGVSIKETRGSSVVSVPLPATTSSLQQGSAGVTVENVFNFNSVSSNTNLHVTHYVSFISDPKQLLLGRPVFIDFKKTNNLLNQTAINWYAPNGTPYTAVGGDSLLVRVHFNKTFDGA